MTRGHPELVATVRILEDYAIAYERAIQVLTDEWHALDWHTTPTTDGTPRGNTITSPVEHTLERKQAIEADLAQLNDDRTTIVSIVHSAREVARTITRRAETIKPEVQRCNGKVDPSCTEAASDHHDPHTGTTLEGLCDRCWLKSCPNCRVREASTRTKITVEDRKVPGCEACWKREWRRARDPRQFVEYQ